MSKMLLAVGLFLSSPAFYGMCRADQASSPLDVVEKAIQAGGGAEKISQYKAIRISGLWTMDGLEPKQRFDGIFQSPNRFRFAVKADDSNDTNEMLFVVKDDQGWEKTPYGIKKMGGDDFVGIKNVVHAICLADLPLSLKSKDYTLSWREKDQFQGDEIDGILATHATYKEVNLLYEKSSGLLRKSIVKFNSPKEADEWGEFDFTDYKDFADVKHFTKLRYRQAQSEVDFELEIKELKLLKDVDAKEFDKPE